MRRAVRGASTALAVLFVLLGGSSPVSACTTDIAKPYQVGNVVGTAFIGTVLPPPGGTPTYNYRDATAWPIQVDEVVAGPLASALVVLPVDGCHDVWFPPGKRVAITTAGVRTADAYDTVGWVIRQDGSLQVIPFEESRSGYAPEFRRITTVAGFRARYGLPQTDAGAPNTPSINAAVGLIVASALGLLTSALWMRQRGRIG